MAIIKQLPPHVVNQIAAGEVIERPASVVKELLENSVDAGARRIDVSIGKGGLETIRVADDGCGIDPEQFPLAVASHATSKIASSEDLFHVGTLGFRGEALASIASISRFLLRSRTGQSQAGYEMEVHGGVATSPAPCGSPVGTVIEVQNLFFNTPVRRKFLRTTQTEMGHITEAFTRIALAFPELHFTLSHNGRQQFDLPPTSQWRERIAALCGSDLAEALIPVASEDAGVSLSGYVADPEFSRGNNRMQYLFLNGRCIRDRALQHALGEAYRGLLLTGRFPIAFLRLDMPADAIDVNVHPSKLEVRFRDSGRLYSQLLGTLRKRFLSTDLTAKVRHGESETAGEQETATQAAALHRQAVVDWARGNGSSPGSEANKPELNYSQQPLQLNRITRTWPNISTHLPPPSPAAETSRPLSEETDGLVEDPFGEAPAAPPRPVSHVPQRLKAMQVHNRYLVAESDDGMVVIDQHALHERILYEQLREKVLSGNLETQKLLVPEPVHFSPQEAAAALEAAETLGQLGLGVESFGGDTVLVTRYPAMLANQNPGDILRELVEKLASGGSPDKRDLLDELLHMIACKAAIKAGDQLTWEEIDALLEQSQDCQDAHHCPHGRPTALVFTRDELDRRFKRT